ncbi:MAG: hypothetical protein QOE25_5 [Actinomycetota bacterium]|nr:hypothetical protein [Actinomycetota bacterium]
MTGAETTAVAVAEAAALAEGTDPGAGDEQPPRISTNVTHASGRDRFTPPLSALVRSTGGAGDRSAR